MTYCLSNMRARLGEDDPYLQEMSRRWQSGIIKLVNELPAPDFSKSIGLASAA